MVTVTKKHQTSMALIAVVLATAMIAGTFASMGNNAFATRGGHSGHSGSASDGKSSAVDQSISESCDQNQNSPISTSGFLSPPIASGINVGACLNLNLGGNTANQDQSTQN